MKMTSAAVSNQPLSRLRLDKSARSRSYDSLQNSELAARRGPDASTTLRPALAAPIREAGKGEDVSRVELLLLAKAPEPVFIPEQDSIASQKVNQAIKASSQWDEIGAIVAAKPILSSSNLAYAIYRLGCIAAHASRKRVADLKASNLIPEVFERALVQLAEMEAASLVLLLDGCARLQHKPFGSQLAQIAGIVQQNAYSLSARQLPLVLWAFSSLDYTPRLEVLLNLEDAVARQAAELSPQGIALVLNGFRAFDHTLTDFTLMHLAKVIQRKLLLFKPSDLAASLKCLSAQGFTPSDTFLQAVAERIGQGAGKLASNVGFPGATLMSHAA